MLIRASGKLLDEASLYRVAADLAGVDVVDVTEIGARLLQSPPDRGALRSRTTLNNDGTPLQVCVSLDYRGRRVRLIGDPGVNASSIRDRLASGRAALNGAFETESLAELGSRLFVNVLPDAIEQRAEASRGVIWLAVTIPGGGRALYVKANWGDAGEDWRRVVAATRRVIRNPLEVEEGIRSLAAAAYPVSVGLESDGAGRAQLKIYWRLHRPVSLASCGVLFEDDSFGDFLRRVLETRLLLASGLVLSASYLSTSGTISGVKADVCAHCVRRSPRQWVELIERLAADHELAAPGIASVLMARRADVAFLGLGVNRRREKRLNVYLKAPDAA